MSGNGKAALVLGGFLILGYFALTSGHPSQTPKPEPVATYAPPPPTYTPPPPPPAPATYTVRAGDGLKAIADAHGVTLGALLQANDFTSSEVPIYAGQVLQLPTGAGATPVPTASPTALTPTPTATYAQPTPTYAVPPRTYQPPTYVAPAAPAPTVWAQTCPNGSCFGDVSPTTGLPKTQYVRPYVKRDGTVVGGYYRSHR